MRAVTIKAKGAGVALVIAYYEGLAAGQLRRNGMSRGPVDYYLDPNESPGRWWGGGCKGAGVRGDVLPEQLRALLEAQHPATGAKLGRGFGDQSARAFDATFSAAKSISVLWALTTDPWARAEILAAHDAAVRAAMAWLQRHGAVTRKGRNGVHQLDTRGLIVAVFRQHTSRTGDPQLHTHVIILAKVQDLAGNWLSLDARFLKRQQRSIGWIYDAALRTELTARLGIGWERVIEGHADIEGVDRNLIELFSERSDQVEAKHTELIAEWRAEHDGAEPTARTLANLERRAVLDSRPDKEHGVDAEVLRRQWQGRVRAAGFKSLSIPAQHHLPISPFVDEQAVVAEALARVSAQGSTWLQADLAREIATLLPPDAAHSGDALVERVDILAAAAASRCIGMHPPAMAATPTRGDGRPVTEDVTSRRLSSESIVRQEARMAAWAKRWNSPPDPSDHPQRDVARAVAGAHRLVLVVGPAGAGKTTTLAAAIETLRRQGRAVVGLAPSGKAADVLAVETGCDATTLAKFLHDHDRPDSYSVERLPEGTTIVVDEASMAPTDDLDHLVQMVDRNRWRLVCVGDPAQLPAVGRGAMFEQWCETVPAYQLEDIRRFADDWQGPASLALRKGKPEAAEIYAAHGRLATVHPSLVAERVADIADAVTANGSTLAITCASAGTARRINVAIQRRSSHLGGRSLLLADGTRVSVGDTVATRRNDRRLLTSTGANVRNRHTWMVMAVRKDGSLAVADDKRGVVVLPTSYVRRHVELGWAVTGYGSQGITTDHGICVVESSSTRAGVYVGMTRGRGINRALILDRSGEADAAEELAAVIARPAQSLTAHMTRDELYRAKGLQPPPVEPPARDPIKRRALSR